MSEHRVTAPLGDHPKSFDEGGIMADMLVVSTGKLCDPMAFFVGMKTGD
jgi:hypothetical protein